MTTTPMSEAFLQQALRAAKIGLWDWDLRANRVAYSAEWKRQLGYAEDEISNELSEWEGRVHPDDLPKLKQRIAEYLRSPWPDYEEHFRIRRKDGSWRWMLTRADLIRDEHGQPARMVGCQLDITSQKLIEIELACANRALRLVSGSNLTLVQLGDETAVLEKICRLAVETGGYKMAWVGLAEQDERKTVRPVAHAGFEPGYLESANITWADEPRGRGPAGIAIRTGRPCVARNIPADPAFELWREAASQAGYQSCVALPLRTEGRVFGNLSIYDAEVDAFSAAEVRVLEELAADLAFGLTVIRTRAERDRASEALKESEGQLRLVIDAIPTMAWIVLPDGAVEFLNQRWLKYSGLSLEEALENPMRTLHPDDIPRVAKNWSVDMAAGEPYEDEMRLRRADGEYRWFLVRTVPMHDERGNIVKWYGTSTDIEDRKRAEEALRETQAALARVARVTTVGELTASIAHEVNQPLGAVVINAEAALRWLAGGPPNLNEAREALQRIIRDGNRAGEVVARIRSLLKNGTPTKTRFNLDDMIGEIIALIHAEAQRRQVSVQTRLEPDLPQLTADRVQLQQVLMNLVMNSLDALNEVAGRPRLLTILAGMDSPGSLRISVQDTGIGIDPRRMKDIFEPFHTTKPNGLGLGLSISRSIIEAHGGHLRAMPNDGPGVTFQFTLPVNGGGGA